MRSITIIISAMGIGILLSACGKPTLDPIEYRQEEIVVVVQGEVYDPGTNSTEDYELSFGPQPAEDVYYSFQSANFSAAEGGGTSLYVAAYDVVPYPWTSPELSFTIIENHPLFTLLFQSDISEQADESPVWSKAEFADFFKPGTVIPVGTATGTVDVGIRLPAVIDIDLPTSKSSYLEWPAGQLTVVATEEHAYSQSTWTNLYGVRGMVVEATLNASVGRYDLEQDELDGMPGYTTTDEVYLRDFRIRFFVPLGN